MTANSTLIQAAFRESNFIAQGADPTENEQAEGLRLLQSMVSSLAGSVIGTKFKPWHIPFVFNTAPEAKRFPAYAENNYIRPEIDEKYPPNNARVILRNTSTQTIYFQNKPNDGAIMSIVDAGFTADVTLDANGMFFETDGNDRTKVIEPRTTGRNPKQDYVFREDTASWNLTSNLLYAGEMPYPEQFDDYWITGLALRLSPSFGEKTTQVTMMRFKEMTTFIRGWYRQHEEVVVGDAGGNAEQAFWTGSYRNDEGGLV